MLRVILLLVALITGGGAAWLAAHARAPQTTVVVEAAPALPSMQEVLVAAADLRAGQPFSGENVRWQRWPESAISPVYITRTSRPDAIEALSGSFVRNTMSVGEPVREENLAQRRGSYFATVLPSGKRAVAVRVSAETTAGGFILPNDRVDVLHTEGEGNDQISRTILRNIPVLAIDQIVDEGSKNDKNSKPTVIGKTATLELDARQAEIVTAAQAKGVLSLSLRSAADNEEAQFGSRPVRIIRAGRAEKVRVN
jgi:pilus assembly protein CpaB